MLVSLGGKARFASNSEEMGEMSLTHLVLSRKVYAAQRVQNLSSIKVHGRGAVVINLSWRVALGEAGKEGEEILDLIIQPESLCADQHLGRLGCRKMTFQSLCPISPITQLNKQSPRRLSGYHILSSSGSLQSFQEKLSC